MLALKMLQQEQNVVIEGVAVISNVYDSKARDRKSA